MARDRLRDVHARVELPDDRAWADLAGDEGGAHDATAGPPSINSGQGKSGKAAGAGEKQAGGSRKTRLLNNKTTVAKSGGGGGSGTIPPRQEQQPPQQPPERQQQRELQGRTPSTTCVPNHQVLKHIKIL